MKNTLLALLCLPSLALATNDSYCYSIADQDQKNSCLAMAKRQASYCYSVREHDAKNFCLAQVGGQKSYCYAIHDSDTKNRCLASVH